MAISDTTHPTIGITSTVNKQKIQMLYCHSVAGCQNRICAQLHAGEGKLLQKENRSRKTELCVLDVWVFGFMHAPVRRSRCWRIPPK